MIVSAFTIEELYCVKTSIQIIILVSLRKHHCHSNEFTNRQPYECNMIQIPTPHVILVLKEIRQHSKKKLIRRKFVLVLTDKHYLQK